MTDSRTLGGLGELPGVAWTRGVPLDYLKDLEYRHAVRRPRRRPSSAITPSSVPRRRPAHPLPARQSDQPDAKPLLITHGFPSSVAEFLQLIEPLVNPAEGQAFHVVAPSLPGYAFHPTAATGWTMGRTARAWVELMRRLGYQRYGVRTASAPACPAWSPASTASM